METNASRAGAAIRRLGVARMLATLLLGASTDWAQAGWTPTAAGTYDYLLPANWSSGIDDTFPSSLTLAGAQILTFGADHTAAGMQFAYAGNYGLTLRGEGGNRTLNLGADITVTPAANQTVTIGSSTANQNLNVDLGGATRTITVGVSKKLTLANVVSNGGLLVVGGGSPGNGGTVTLSGANTFAGGLEARNCGIIAVGSEAGLGPAPSVVRLDTGGQFNVPGTAPLSIDRSIEIGAGGGTLTIGNTVANLLGPIRATGTLTLNGSNVANISLVSSNSLAGGISFGSLTFLAAASDTNLGGPSTTFRSNVRLSLIGSFMTDFGDHPLDAITAVHLELQDPTCVFTITNSFTRNANSAGNPLFAKYGPGTTIIAAPQTYNNTQTTYDTAVLGGTLVLDANQGGSLYNAQRATGGSIALGPGTFVLKGKASGVTTQAVYGVYLDGVLPNGGYNRTGSAKVIVDDNGGAGTTFKMNALTVLTSYGYGTTLDIATVGANARATTTTANDTTGLLGSGRVTFNGADWSAADGSGVIGAYAGYTSGLPATGADSGLNYLVTGSATVAASETANTLKLAPSAAGHSLALASGQALTLASGALLFTGAHNYAITGGTLKSATATTSDLMLQHFGEGVLTIDSILADGNGASVLTKSGPGTVILTGVNTYTGSTYINDGVLSITNNAQLGLQTTGAKIYLQGGTLRATETLSLSNGSSNKRVICIGGDGATFDVAAGKDLTIANSISGIQIGGTTTSKGPGRLVLHNSDGGDGMLTINAVSYFTSGFVIECGILRMMHSQALNPIGVNTVTFGNGATAKLVLRGSSVVIAGLYGTNVHAMVANDYAGGAPTMTIANGGDCTFGGKLIDGTGGVLSLAKLGCGKQTLTGASTYTGSTTIQDGTLEVNGSLTSATTVSGGALGGTGTIAGPVSVTAGGTLAPGASVGTLSTGALTLDNAAALNFELAAPETGDRVAVTGDLSLDGVLNIADAGGFGPGRYTLFTYTGALTNGQLAIGTTPDTRLVYAIDTATAGVVYLRVAAPGTRIILR